MSALVFVCPKTGRAIESGIDIDRDTLSKVRLLSISIRCAHCGSEHQQPVKNGRLAEAA
jgi:predicted RNA-binding Zn-ribbon protein involved in translation (DUF1610 family)